MKDLRVPCKNCSFNMLATDKFCSRCGEKNGYTAGEVINLLISSPKPEHKVLLDKLEGKIEKTIKAGKTSSASIENTNIVTTTEKDKYQSNPKELNKQKLLTPQEELAAKVKRHNIIILLPRVTFLIAGLASVFGAFYYNSIHGTSSIWSCAFTLGSIYLAGLGAFFLSEAWVKECRNCNALNGVEQDEAKSDKLLDTTSGYETVTRQVKNREGKVVQEYQEQVRVQKKSYLVHYKCVVCGNESTKSKQTSSQDFDN